MNTLGGETVMNEFVALTCFTVNVAVLTIGMPLAIAVSVEAPSRLLVTVKVA
jgi:hypothetical protein